MRLKSVCYIKDINKIKKIWHENQHIVNLNRLIFVERVKDNSFVRIQLGKQKKNVKTTQHDFSYGINQLYSNGLIYNKSNHRKKRSKRKQSSKTGIKMVTESYKQSEYIELLKQLDSLPKIKGWVARKFYGDLWLFKHKPEKFSHDNDWIDDTGQSINIDSRLFSELTKNDEPIEVELLIRKI